MKNRLHILGALVALLFTASAQAAPKSYPYRVATTVGMITDVVRNVAGDKAEVEGLIGEGIDPHLYKPTRRDLIALRRADVIFYNGLMLEGKMADVLTKVARSKPVYAVTEGIQELPAVDQEALERKLEAEEQLYQNVMAKFQSTMAEAAAQAPQARIQAVATAPTAKANIGGQQVYQAKTTLQVFRSDASDDAGIAIAQNAVRSKDVLDAVEASLTPAQQSALIEPYVNKSVSAALSQHLQVEQVGQAWILYLTYRHPDNAKLAADIANAFAEQTLENLNQQKAKVSMQNTDSAPLREQAEKLRAQIEKTRSQLKEAGGYVLNDESEHYDPHVWMDVRGWIQATKVVANALAEYDPKNADYYQKNAKAYIAKLQKLDDYARQAIGSIPEQQRYLVTAHDAFNYMGRAYDIEVRGIQGLSTESEAGVRDIEQLINFLVENQIPAVFVETSVSDKNIRALIEGAAARGHSLVIGGELFSDAMGTPGSYEGTYIGMIDHNATTIARALGGEAPEKGLNGKLTGAH